MAFIHDSQLRLGAVLATNYHKNVADVLPFVPCLAAKTVPSGDSRFQIVYRQALVEGKHTDKDGNPRTTVYNRPNSTAAWRMDVKTSGIVQSNLQFVRVQVCSNTNGPARLSRVYFAMSKQSYASLVKVCKESNLVFPDPIEGIRGLSSVSEVVESLFSRVHFDGKNIVSAAPAACRPRLS